MNPSVDKTMISFNSEDLHPRLTILFSCKLFSFDSGSYRRLILGFHADSCLPVSPVLSLNAAKVALVGKSCTKGNKGSLSLLSHCMTSLRYNYISPHAHIFHIRTKIITTNWHMLLHSSGLWEKQS